MENPINTFQQRRPMAVDGLRPRAAAAQPAQPVERRVYSAPRPEVQESRFWQKLQLPLLLLAGAVGGFFAESLALGLSMLAIYGLVAFITRIPSRTTFTLALLLLAAISVMLLAKPSASLIRNFSSYAFVLLLIGVITLGREARLPKRMPRKYRR